MGIFLQSDLREKMVHFQLFAIFCSGYQQLNLQLNYLAAYFVVLNVYYEEMESLSIEDGHLILCV